MVEYCRYSKMHHNFVFLEKAVGGSFISIKTGFCKRGMYVATFCKALKLKNRLQARFFFLRSKQVGALHEPEWTNDQILLFSQKRINHQHLVLPEQKYFLPSIFPLPYKDFNFVCTSKKVLKSVSLMSNVSIVLLL